LQWLRKPPTSYLLGWFAAYGPVLALLVFDWKNVARDLRAQPILLVFVALCSALAYFGGSDTERFVFWSMPVVYLLIARAFERHLLVFRSAAIAVALLASQAVSARLFWTIPDPKAEANPLTANAGLGDQIYAVLDRLVVIDHFHMNLWSSFGSQPFKLVRLALYLVVTAALVMMMHRRARVVEAY
jgi:hypothetical protein